MTRFLVLAGLLVACGDPGGAAGNEGELITTVTLTFAPPGGPPRSFVFEDADGDGGAPPTADRIELASSTSYTLTIELENRLEAPPEPITDEVRDEADDHQLFFTGDAIERGALVHTYADTDDNGLPLGLENTMLTDGGTAVTSLVVTLRHMPPVNDTPVKTATSADEVTAGGFSAIGGTTDASVLFDVDVL